jgi:Ca2+-binding RTX toxin-like protein
VSVISVAHLGVAVATIAAVGAIATPNAFAATLSIEDSSGTVAVGGTLKSTTTLGAHAQDGSTVDIALLRGADCSGAVVRTTTWGDGKRANGDPDPNDVITDVNQSTTFTFSVGNADGGTFSWRAILHESGSPDQTDCSGAVNVATTTPSMTVTAVNAATGGVIRATANLTNRVKQPVDGPEPAITFKAYAPSDSSCSGSPVATSTRKVFTNQSAYTSDNYTAATPGTYRWRISYTGDGNNAAITTPCGTPSSQVADGTTPPTDGPTCNGVPATIVGGKKGETILGTKGVDVIVARGGRDIVNGRGGNDIICGGAGNDILRGGGGNDIIFGGAGSDDVQGGKGNDELHGDAGGDRIVGGKGNDRLYGGKGNDGLDGGKGRDFGDGGPGTDVARSIERVPARS